MSCYLTFFESTLKAVFKYQVKSTNIFSILSEALDYTGFLLIYDTKVDLNHLYKICFKVQVTS